MDISNLVYPHCTRCGLSTTRTMVVQPEYPPTMRVLFLGRDPGAIEDVEGTPFHSTAPAGKLLRALIREVGIPLEWCGFDNVVRCHTPKNRGPKADEVLACYAWTMHLVGRWPEYIVTLGQEALEALDNPVDYHPTKPITKLSEAHGNSHQYHTGYTSHTGNQRIPMYHPSAALRNGAMRRALVGDLRRLAAILGVVPREPSYVPDQFLGEPYAYALDFETARDGAVLGVGLAWRDYGQSVVSAEWIDAAHLYYLDGFNHLSTPIIMHNAKFDWPLLERVVGPLKPTRLHDTMLMAYVLRREEVVGSLGLKELALADLGLSWAGQETYGHPEDMDDATCQHYCLQDATATLLLYEKYRREVG